MHINKVIQIFNLLLGSKNKNIPLSYSLVQSREIFGLTHDPFRSTFSVSWNKKDVLVTNTMPAISTTPKNIFLGTIAEGIDRIFKDIFNRKRVESNKIGHLKWF